MLEAGRIRHTSLRSEIEHMARHNDIVVVMGGDRVTDPPDGVAVLCPARECRQAGARHSH
jgi:hypothetical protein